MSRSSTSTTSSSHPKASPPVSVPSLSRATTQASPPELPSFGNNAIDDFVLFPEDNASWNPADMSLPEFDENLDLSQFNFDVSGLNDCPSITNTANQSFDFSFFDQQPATSFQLDHSLGHNPYVADQYGLDQWASAQGGDLSVSHTRPHHSISSQDSGQLDSSWFDSGLQSTESPGSQTTPSSLGMSEFAENFWPNGAVSHRQIAQSSSVSRPSAEADWSTLESGILPSPDGDFPSASMNRRDRRNMRVVERSRNAAIQQFVDSIPSAHADESPRAIVDAFDVQQPTGSSSPSTTDSIFDQPSSPGAATGGSLEYWGLESTCAFVAEATQALKSAPAAYQPIFEELQRLRGVLEVIKSGDTERTPVWQQAMVSELQILTSQLQVLFIRIKNTLRTSRVEESQRYNRLDPEVHPDYLQQCSVLTRRLVSALCATINCLKTQDIGTGGTYAATNSPILSSGNFQLTVAANSPTQTHPQDSDVYVPEGSYLSLSSGSSSLPGGAMNSALVRQELGKTTILDLRQGDRHDGAGWPTLCGAIGSGSVDIATIDKVSKYSLVTKPAFERLSRLVGEESSQTAILTGLERHSSALGQQETIFSALPFDTPTSSMGWWREAARLHQVQLFEQESSRIFDAPNLTPQIVNPHSEGGPTILPDRDHTFRPQLTAASLVTSVQNFGSPGSDSLSQQSEASSPGANPRTVLDNFATWHNRGTGRPADSFGVLANYIVMLTSLLLLNVRRPPFLFYQATAKQNLLFFFHRADMQQSLQANTLILILATLFLAVPHPTPAMITLIAMTVVIQATPISSLMSGLKYLVPAVIMSAPLFKNSLDGSLESVWSVRPPPPPLLSLPPLGTIFETVTSFDTPQSPLHIIPTCKPISRAGPAHINERSSTNRHTVKRRTLNPSRTAKIPRS